MLSSIPGKVLMNGRCATDPFDQAVNVCQSCYGEFCGDCLLQVKGQRHPVCKECAIIASGVRPGARPAVRGDRKTVKRRRKALAEQQRDVAVFHYFDEEPKAESPVDEPIESMLATPPIEEPATGGPEAEAEAGFDAAYDRVETSVAGAAPSGVSAMEQLQSLRGQHPTGAAPTSNLAALKGLASVQPAEPEPMVAESQLPMPSLDLDPFTLKPIAAAPNDETPPAGQPASWTTKSLADIEEQTSASSSAEDGSEQPENGLFHSN